MMKLRWVGLSSILVAGVAHFACLVPVRREVAGLQAGFAAMRVSREAKRGELIRLEAVRRGASGPGGDPVALALDLRPGLVACFERAGLSTVEFGFDGDSFDRLRFRMAARGGFAETLGALDCVTSPASGVVPDSVTVARVSGDLRLALTAVPGRVPRATSRTQVLPRDPFVADSVTSEAPASRLATLSSPEPVAVAPPSPAAPEIRLVGLVERHGKHLAALSIRGEVFLASIGELVAGYELSSVDPGSGAVLTDASGEKLHLRLLDAE